MICSCLGQDRDPELNLNARAQAFLDRITPLSADLAAHGTPALWP
jgi:hypothetical protein